MSSLNKVILIGNLGRDPEIKSFPSGGKIANFSIATSESWRDKQTGEKREKTEWHNISVKSEGLVKVIESYVKKGSKVYVEGQLQTRKWQDKDGNDRFTTEVVLGSFNSQLVLLGGKNESAATQKPSGDAYRDAGFDDEPARTTLHDIDDEIPF